MKLEGRKTKARLQTQLERREAPSILGGLTQDVSTTLTATYKGGEAGLAVSNTWVINLKDSVDNTKTFRGDQWTKIICTETQQDVVADKLRYGTYAWCEISRAACRRSLRCASKSIASCAYSMSARGYFCIKPQATNDAKWRAAA